MRRSARFFPRSWSCGAVSRAVCVATALGLLGGCATLATQRRNVHDEAQDLNIASRFGRQDVASQFTAPEARRVFLARRKKWGTEVQVLDLQIDHVHMKDKEHAEVTLQVDWTKPSEGLLRSTWLTQTWHSKNQGPWRLEAERRVNGDRGLFGERTAAKSLTHANDTHFQTRSLGTVE